MDWEDIRIFISSTFNDMHAERDYLVKDVFPQLAQWCEARRLRLTDIDLRWGITSTDSEKSNTVKKCLENIDKCRPFFLCFLGQRRGWVPDDPKRQAAVSRSEISRETLEEYPGVAQLRGKNSVTEMEIEHALLSPLLRIADGAQTTPEAARRALFFFREDSFTGGLTPAQRLIYTNDMREGAGDSEAADRALAQLKEKINSNHGSMAYSCRWDKSARTPELLAEENGQELSQGRLTDFAVNASCLDEGTLALIHSEFPELINRQSFPLKYVIIAGLMREILREYPQRSEPYGSSESVYDADLTQQELFCQLTAQEYIEQPEQIELLKQHFESDGRILLLAAQAGLGKTTLLAHFVGRMREKQTVYYRFCGVSDLSNEQYSLWESIFRQAEIDCPQTMDELKRDMPGLLSKLAGKEGALVIIDGVNQIRGGMDMLSWLPHELPQGVKMILSTKADERTESLILALENSGTIAVKRISPVQSIEQKERMIDKFLERYLKSLDQSQLNTICALPYSGNPLFLKILLHELRRFGSFKQLEAEIARYGTTPISAFNAVLERLENDSSFDVLAPEVFVPTLFGLLACSRSGLSEDEIVSSFSHVFAGEDQEKIAGTTRLFIRQVRPFMARRDGRADFLYESFKIAAENRYKKGSLRLHEALAHCFRAYADPSGDGSYSGNSPRALTEYAYHLKQCDSASASQLYGSVAYLTARCSHTPVRGLLEELDGQEAQQRKYREIIFRYKQELSQYRNLLPSLLYYSDSDEVKNSVLAAQSSGVLKTPWLKADAVESTVTPDAQKNDSSEISFRKTSEKDLGHASAVALAKDAPLAFYTAGRGRISIADTRTLEPYGSVISVSEKSMLSLEASSDGGYLLAAFEDATAELVRLSFDADTVFAEKQGGKLEYLLPADTSGVFAFDISCLWYQDCDENLVRLELSSGTETMKIPMDGEISSICIGESTVCVSVWSRSGASVFVYSADNGSLLAQRKFDGDDIVIMESAGTGFVAASLLSRPEYKVFLLDENLQEIRSISLESAVAAVCKFGDKLLIVPRQHKNKEMYLWSYDGGGELSAMKQGFDFLGRLVIAGGSDYLSLISSHSLLKLEPAKGGTVEKRNTNGAAPPESEKIPLPSVRAENGATYFYDLDGSIGCEQNSHSVDLSDYMIGTIRLYSFGSFLALTGAAQNNAAVARSAPYIVIFFEILTDGRLKKVGERYFPVVFEPIECLCFEPDAKNVYLFFVKSDTGEIQTNPYLIYGTVQEILSGQDKRGFLNCPERGISALASKGRLCVCSRGILTVHKAENLEYETAFVAPEALKLKVSDSQNGLSAIIGDENAVRLTIQN